MKHDNDADNLAQKKEEVELLLIVYPDLVTTVGTNLVRVRLASDIEVVFRLPPGYPANCPPEHQITVPAYLSEVRERISNKLEENYELYAGFQLLVSCIAEINNIANNLVTQNDSGISDEGVDEKAAQQVHVTRIPSKHYNWISGQIFEDRKSTFQAHFVWIESRNDASAALDQLKENNKISRATHNIYAYVVVSPDGHEQSDCYDDGEKGAGPKLLQMLKMMKVENALVVVSRWYGGIHLGPDRFRHICNVARAIVLQCRESNP